MIIRDEATQEREVVQRGFAENQALINQLLADQMSLCGLVSDLTTHTDKAGQFLSTSKFEERIKKLIPSVTFHPHPKFADKRYLRPNPNRPHETVVYENPMMPERSVMEILRKKQIQPGILGPHGRTISRDELPKYETTPAKFDASGNIVALGEIIWEDNALPAGMEWIDTPGREIMRGWRTVLVYLIGGKYITPDQAERAFGPANTREWAKHTGKRSVSLPW